jgi:hypothetical protein
MRSLIIQAIAFLHDIKQKFGKQKIAICSWTVQGWPGIPSGNYREIPSWEIL